MPRPKEPRTVVLEALTEVRKQTLMLAKIWKMRNVALTSARWGNLAQWARYLSAIFDEMAGFATLMEADEKAKGN